MCVPQDAEKLLPGGSLFVPPAKRFMVTEPLSGPTGYVLVGTSSRKRGDNTRELLCTKWKQVCVTKYSMSNPEIPVGCVTDLRGEKFHLWTVLYRTHNVGTKVTWVCECECGTVRAVRGTSLTDHSRPTKSCGCTLYTDLTGKVFGRLTAIEPTDDRDNQRNVMWLCECSCGNLVKVASANLGKNTNSCGCLYTEMLDVRPKGELHPRWKHERTDEERKDRRQYPEYNEWRSRVFERDNYTCQACGQYGNGLAAHHIYGYRDFPTLRLCLNNGTTLCRDCHVKYHTWAGGVHIVATLELYTEWTGQ